MLEKYTGPDKLNDNDMLIEENSKSVVALCMIDNFYEIIANHGRSEDDEPIVIGAVYYEDRESKETDSKPIYFSQNIELKEAREKQPVRAKSLSRSLDSECPPANATFSCPCGNAVVYYVPGMKHPAVCYKS